MNDLKLAITGTGMRLGIGCYKNLQYEMAKGYVQLVRC